MDLGPYCLGTLNYQPSIFYKYEKWSEEEEDEKKKKKKKTIVPPRQKSSLS